MNDNRVHHLIIFDFIINNRSIFSFSATWQIALVIASVVMVMIVVVIVAAASSVEI